MKNAYQRKKQPDEVRRLIILAIQSIVASKGLAALSMASAAERAGVAKGGLLHHFPTRNSMLEAATADILDKVESRINTHLSEDPISYGRFTRAYIRCVLTSDSSIEEVNIQRFPMALWNEPGLLKPWDNWMQTQLARHTATDGAKALQIVRYALEGIWASKAFNAGMVEDSDTLRESLLALTSIGAVTSMNTIIMK